MSTPMKAWVYALAALQVEADGGDHQVLGGSPDAIEKDEVHRRRLAKRYGVTTEAGLVDLLEGYSAPGPTPPPVDPGLFEGELGRLLGPHREVLERAGWTAWRTHHAVAAAGLGSLAGLANHARLSPFLNRAAAQARAAYTSWETYGRHVLLGEAAHTGRWNTPLARAFERLLDEPLSPWRTLPWALYPIPREGPVAVWLSLQVRCSGCETWTPVARLGVDARCANCLAVIELKPASWRFLTPLFDKLRWWPEGFVDEGDNFETDARHRYSCGVGWPRCGCGAALTVGTPASQPEASGSTQLLCPGCGAATPARTPDPLLRERLPDALYIVGESSAEAAAGLLPAAVVLACECCGAPQTPTPEARVICCDHCHRVAPLPDELWARLHPRPPLVTITLVGTPRPALEGPAARAATPR
jgi:Protein of unknown function (DUF1266)